MSKTKILLAGPGTGKTTKIEKLINEHADASKILVISFTNGTVNDLLKTFLNAGIGISDRNCMTLHKFALKANHLLDVQVLSQAETYILMKYAEWCGVEFVSLCKILKCISFQNMINDCGDFIKTNPEFAKQKIGDIDLLIVDEYQDFNEEERKLIDAITNYVNETIILGDDDQCIYGFKNADSEGITSLYSSPEIEKLEHENICFRCPDEVVDGARNLIVKNKKRVEKDWKKNNKEGRLHIVQHNTQKQTAEYVTEHIKKTQESEPGSSIMVLSPNRSITTHIIEMLESENIEFNDHINKDSTDAQLTQVFYLRSIFGKNKLINLMFLLYPHLKGKKPVREKVVKELRKCFDTNVDDPSTIDYLVKLNLLDKKFSEYILNEPSIESFFEEHNDFENFKKFFTEEGDKEKSLKKIIEFLIQKNEPNDSVPNIMTIHGSKGLGANLVFIVGIVDGILPKNSSGSDTIEAERRLLYVGMTRAKKDLHLISTIEWEPQIAYKLDASKFGYRGRLRTAKTSPFIAEIINK